MGYTFRVRAGEAFKGDIGFRAWGLGFGGFGVQDKGV